MSRLEIVPEPRPRSTREANPTELLERTQRLRLELSRRGESLSPSWVEEAARDLRSGQLEGWWFPESGGASGLAFHSARGARAFGHVHVDPGTEAPARAFSLLRELVRSFPSAVHRADIGLSGLPDAEEAALGSRAMVELGGSVLVRRCLERPLERTDRTDPPLPTPGQRVVSVRSLPVDQLARLDWNAFQGTPDEALIADTLEEDQRGLGELLDNRLGRFLELASPALLASDGRPVGALLAAEQAPGTAIILDLVVEPSERRRGVGSFLMRRSFRALQGLDFRAARLWVTETNRPALALYERLGFRSIASARIYRWNSPKVGVPSHPHTAL